MMLTKEECKEALSEIEYSLCELEEIKAGVVVTCLFDENLETIKQLIEEHFDNPPLEWEELKECNVVYDKEQKKFRLIEDFLENGKRIVFTNTIDSFITENYEPNRFYRKEVQK